ncbi:MAG: T9SS type A sorting domain-containing protein [Candidatus Marinimicrobia bacterium]|nr:T9SS type A sorting domain-containing protein [Candidatus Neomarinimicrobiota bacterium]
MIYTEIPEMPTPCKDIALRLTKTEDGTQPASLKIFIDKPIITSFPVTNYLIICYVSDTENRLCADSFQISLTLEGPGIISNPQVTTNNGVAVFNYLPEQGKSGEVIFTASTEGLASVSLFNNVLSEIEVEKNASIPTEFALKANYPNPFNASTVIEFSLPKTTNIKIDVYNLAGQLVETLVRGRQSAGNYKIFWHPANLPSGIYLYQITCPEFTATRKCMILK